MIEDIEYAIELPGVGIYSTWTGTISTDFHSIDKIEDAVKSLDTARAKYRSLGCPVQADALRLVRRSRILTYTEWELVST